MEKKLDAPASDHHTVLKWSYTLKHEDFQIQGSVCMRIDYSVFRYAGFLADTPLLDSSPIPYVWYIRLTKHDRFFVGICLEKVSKDNMFMPGRWDDPGHGYYIVRDDGWVWSSTDSELNDKRKYPFQHMKSGDLIKLAYNPSDSSLTVSPNSDSHFRLTVDAAPSGDVYRPCVFNSQTGDSAELVDMK